MIRAIFLLIGAAVFAYLVVQLGPLEIARTVQRAGWGVPVVTLLYAAYLVLRSAALRSSFVTPGSVSLADTVQVNLSGEAVQTVTFAGPLAGEPAKVFLFIRRGLTIDEAFAGVVAEYLVYTLISAVLSIVGLAGLLLYFAPPPGVAIAARVVLVVMAAFLIVSTIAIVRRIYLIGGAVAALGRLPIAGRFLRVDAAATRRMEDALLLVLRERPGQLLRIAALDTLAHAMLVLEVAAVLYSLHASVPLSYPFLIDTTTKVTSVAFFFVPAQVGAAEWTYAIVFEAMGLGATAGFALAFIRRVRTMLVAIAGFAVLTSSRWWARRRSGYSSP